MVYVVYSLEDKFDGVYENKDEAEMCCRRITADTNSLWMVADLPYFKAENTKIQYSEEDSNVDETYYIDEIMSLKKIVYSENKKFKILEEFTNFFIILLLISIMYMFVILLILMLDHKY